MNHLANAIRRITSVTAAISGIFLLLLTTFTVANILLRFVDLSILGFYEISVFIIVVAVACAFAYTTWERGHVVVMMVVDRLSQLPKRISVLITSVISLFVVALIAWASVLTLRERWLGELTEMHDIPFLPFRFIFVFGFALYFLVLLVQIYKSLRERKLKKGDE
jgi:TRAP-type C4-dicarboxylate transport system permease small subunit